MPVVYVHMVLDTVGVLSFRLCSMLCVVGNEESVLVGCQQHAGAEWVTCGRSLHRPDRHMLLRYRFNNSSGRHGGCPKWHMCLIVLLSQLQSPVFCDFACLLGSVFLQAGLLEAIQLP